MIGIRIKSSKEFMNRLLMTEAFRDFLFVEGKMITSISYRLDGRLQKDFFSQEEWQDSSCHPYEFAKWEDMRPLIVQMIKGKHTPVFMRITLQQKPELSEQYLSTVAGEMEKNLIQGLLCTVKYENGQVMLTTGVSYSGLVLDKAPEKGWDQSILQLLHKNNIEYDLSQ